MDYFQIELGVVKGGEKEIHYASNLQKPRPETRRGLGGEQEKRLYMLWASGALRRFDQQLLRAAGLQPEGRIVVQFYPALVEEQLARIEWAVK